MDTSQLTLWDEGDLIMAYVPDAEYMTYEDAVVLAHQRDDEAAVGLFQSVLEVLGDEPWQK